MGTKKNKLQLKKQKVRENKDNSIKRTQTFLVHITHP